MLQSESTSSFKRDVKRLLRKHKNMSKLKDVMRLIIEDSAESKIMLHTRHRAHALTGQWSDCSECHIHNEGDWLLIWQRNDQMVVFLRTGSHDELFKSI
ncbi:type II toxin-antitoxin system YafQ family toxin [Bifidobacterium aquikefiricola]|uniref:Type II toxin-antitoxin system YafQ family toxin n=1 Tax=Bifidobacterium aquikefiricola TaxID=3059038 RepID=A0AB39U6H3_9BIFI